MGILTDIWEAQKEFKKLEKERKQREKEEREKQKLEEQQSKIIESNEPIIINIEDIEETEYDEETGEFISEEQTTVDTLESDLVLSGGVLCYTKYDVPNFEPEPAKFTKKGVLAEPYKKRYGQYLAFIDVVKYYRSKEYCSILTLAQTSKPFIEIWGLQSIVSPAFKLLVDMKFMEIESDSYQPGVKGKSYRYYVENEKKLIEHCKKYNIPKYKAITFQELTPKEKQELIDEYNSKSKVDLTGKVLFNSKLKGVRRPEGMSTKKFKKLLTEKLYEEYPGYVLIRRLVEKINKTYYQNDEGLELKFNPTFTWTHKKRKGVIVRKFDKVSKIGIRVTNKLCSSKTEGELTPETKVKLREEVLEERGYHLYKDITSSVPRVSWALTYGQWVNDDVDFYKKIYEFYKPEHTVEEFLSERDAIKKLLFRTYFDNTDKNLGHHTWRKMTHNKLSETVVKTEMVNLRRAVEAVLGGVLYNNYIFYAESVIYIDTLHYLLERGYDVWLVYDCFYGKGLGTNEEFEKIVLDAVNVSFIRFKFARDFNAWKEIYGDKETEIV